MYVCMYVCICGFSAAEVIYANVDMDANIIFGALVDDKVTSGEVDCIRRYIHPDLTYIHCSFSLQPLTAMTGVYNGVGHGLRDRFLLFGCRERRGGQGCRRPAGRLPLLREETLFSEVPYAVLLCASNGHL